MNNKLRILHKKFTEGEISRQEFRAYIKVELDKLENELMEDAITPDEYIVRYNELIAKEAEMYAEAFQPHEHI